MESCLVLRKISDFKRVVIKVGSALLVDHESGKLKADWLASLAEDIAILEKQDIDVIVVSSGAIALGCHVLGLSRTSLKLEESQAAAATGQIALAPAWNEALGKNNLKTGQLLLTLSDTEERRRYLNARATIETLLKLGAVPIINENDTIATSEIRYGDNDRLAARVATMADADCLVLLSDVDGLYTASPSQNTDAKHIPVVKRISADIEAMAGTAGNAFSSGGMRTKIEAAKIANAGGTAMVIASGQAINPISSVDKGGRCTWFEPDAHPVTARKKWISGHLDPHGKLFLDRGAVHALKGGKSLLPAGVTRIEGNFERGDTVSICALDGEEIARGLVGYDAPDATKIIGKRTNEIEATLGYPARAALVHRDDMVMRPVSEKS